MNIGMQQTVFRAAGDAKRSTLQLISESGRIHRSPRKEEMFVSETSQEDKYPDAMEPGKFKSAFTADDRYYSRWASHDDIVDKVLAGRYDSLTPKVSEFIPTMNCPFRCPTCQFRDTKSDMRAWKEENESSNLVMKVSSAKSFLDKLIDGGCRGIHFTGGGEPTYHPNLYDIARHAKERGALLSMSSNGTFLRGITPEQIIELEFHRIRISLDTITNHPSFHGYSPEKKYLSVVLGNIKRLVQKRAAMSGRTLVIICILFDARNHAEIPALGAAIAEMQGVDHVVIRPVQDYYNTKHMASLSKYSLEDTVKMIQGEFTDTLSRAGIHVYVPAYRLTGLGRATKEFTECRACGLVGELMPDGNMYMCTETCGINNFCIGSLSQNTLKKVYSSSRYNSVRLSVGFDNFKRCPVTARPLELNRVFQKIEDLRQRGQSELLIRWVSALRSMHPEPDPWIMI